MKWDNDRYKFLKQTIFDIIRVELIEEDAARITIRELCDSIDQMIDKLIKVEGDN